MTYDPAQRQVADARARDVALAVTTHVSWHAVPVGPMLSPAFASYLYVDTAQLLLVSTGAALPLACQLADRAAREARSDVLVVTGDHGDSVAFALGLWSRHGVRWQCPVMPWLGDDGLLWMVAIGQGSAGAPPDGTAFPLRRGRLVDEPAPWASSPDHAAGEQRARRWLAGVTTGHRRGDGA